jgi:quercetin dioxygenase-like cupin family protein
VTESALGPSGSGTVVLDLGPGSGALVLHTPPELNGAEIEVGAPGRPRTHSRVRPRLTAAGPQHAAVYPALAPGDYVIWHDADTPAMTITVAAGRVTTAWWPGPAGPRPEL